MGFFYSAFGYRYSGRGCFFFIGVEEKEYKGIVFSNSLFRILGIGVRRVGGSVETLVRWERVVFCYLECFCRRVISVLKLSFGVGSWFVFTSREWKIFRFF